jgi:hypothetical protein
MKDRVGNTMPSEADVNKLVGEIASVRAKAEKFCVQLTSEERKKAVKFREGGDAIAALVGKLLDEHAVTLPGVSRESIAADVQLARRLEPLRSAVVSLLQLIDDTILEAESEAWWATTAGYTALARISKGDARLEADLKPVVTFFRIGKRTPKAPTG